jgi:hypothetical protein
MILVAAITAAVAAVLGGANYLFGPKVPLYEFQVLWPPLFLPTGWNELSATLYAHVELQNDNVVRTNVHAASFDLFFPDWDHHLVHFGHVQDLAQYQHNATSPEAIWSMAPHNLFSTQDSVRLQIPLSNLLTILSHLLYQAVIGGGVIHLPSTGVVHIKAPHAKLTMAMICDTTLHLVTMKMEGKACAIQHLTPGWKVMQDQVRMMQQHATHKVHWNPETWSVLGSEHHRRSTPSTTTTTASATHAMVNANTKTPKTNQKRGIPR